MIILPDRYLLLSVFAVSLFFVGCENSEPKQNSQQVSTPSSAESSPKTEVVTGMAYNETIDLFGATVHGYETTQIMAKVSGYVEDIGTVGKGDTTEEIDLGSAVSEGTLLATLDVPEMLDELAGQQAQLEQANSHVEQANASKTQADAEVTSRKAVVDEAKSKKSEKVAFLKLQSSKYARIAKLYESGSIGKESLDEAKFALDAAESALVSVDAAIRTVQAKQLQATADVIKASADIQSAKSQVKVVAAALSRVKTLMAYAKIESPFSGIITKRMIDHGTFVRPAGSNSGAVPLFEITRVDKVRVKTSVPSVKANRVALGQKALLHTIGGLPGISVAGSITRSSGALEKGTRMLPIEVHFTNPAKDTETGEDVWLRPGLFGTLQIAVQSWSEENQLPVVPVSAVATDADGDNYVMLVTENSTYKKQPVDIAFNDAVKIGISRGLNVGQTVVTSDVESLKDGQTVSSAE
jgi:RND family efflux transporter MFP subunit